MGYECPGGIIIKSENTKKDTIDQVADEGTAPILKKVEETPYFR